VVGKQRKQENEDPMTYTQIEKAIWEDDKKLEDLSLVPAELRAWRVLDKLNDLRGFDDWWDCVKDADEQDGVFKALVKACR
jgi:hypothetical protein